MKCRHLNLWTSLLGLFSLLCLHFVFPKSMLFLKISILISLVTIHYSIIHNFIIHWFEKFLVFFLIRISISWCWFFALFHFGQIEYKNSFNGCDMHWNLSRVCYMFKVRKCPWTNKKNMYSAVYPVFSVGFDFFSLLLYSFLVLNFILLFYQFLGYFHLNYTKSYSNY